MFRQRHIMKKAYKQEAVNSASVKELVVCEEMLRR